MRGAFQSGATEPSVRDREIFSEKQLEEGYRLACQSYPTGVYEIEIPQKEEEIEVLSGWQEEKRLFGEHGKAEDRTHGGNKAEQPEYASYGICIDIGTTTLAALLVNLETEADCQTAVPSITRELMARMCFQEFLHLMVEKSGRYNGVSGRIFRN